MDKQFLKDPKNVNPTIALIAVVVVSIILVLISLAIFLKSDSYTTLKRIQTGLKTSSNLDESKYDTKSPVKSSDIDKFNAQVQQQVKSVESSEDLRLDEANLKIYN